MCETKQILFEVLQGDVYIFVEYSERKNENTVYNSSVTHDTAYICKCKECGQGYINRLICTHAFHLLMQESEGKSILRKSKPIKVRQTFLYDRRAFFVYIRDTKSNQTTQKQHPSQKLLTQAKCSPPEDLRGHSGGLAATGVPDTIHQHNHEGSLQKELISI